MSLAEAAAVTNGALTGDATFTGVAIDSRAVRRGDLFVAIDGEHRDGHDFIRQASANGAVGALVSATVDQRLPQVKVDDTTVALGELGANWRARFDLPVVAVTGSNGKTTVTAMVAAIFNAAGDCLSPRASFNNQWGVPLTLLRLRDCHTHLVVELGMNRAGEIKKLAALARPNIGVITNIAPAHLAGLKDIKSIADAKAEIFTALADDGVAVLNADDDFYDYHRRRVDTVVSFGTRDADVAVADIVTGVSGVSFKLTVAGAPTRINLTMFGAHNAMNAAAAAAVATTAGVGVAQIKTGLESVAAINGRLRQRDGVGGAAVLDDSYNANPASVTAALDVLAKFDGVRVAVFGAMAELGDDSGKFHRAVGEHAKRAGVQHLFCLNADGYARGFGDGAVCFDKLEPLLEKLTPMLTGGVSVLIKGSRASAMERVVAAVVTDDDGELKC